MSAATIESAQRAAGFIAARSRADWAGAEELLAGFETEAERSTAFAFLAELSMKLLADLDGSDVEAVAGQLALAMAAVSPNGSHDA